MLLAQVVTDSLWDMTEYNIGVRYDDFAGMRQAAVVVGTAVGEVVRAGS
jgi:hypothetical protein